MIKIFCHHEWLQHLFVTTKLFCIKYLVYCHCNSTKEIHVVATTCTIGFLTWHQYDCFAVQYAFVSDCCCNIALIESHGIYILPFSMFLIQIQVTIISSMSKSTKRQYVSMDYSTDSRDVLRCYDSNSQVVTFSWISNMSSGLWAILTYSIFNGSRVISLNLYSIQLCINTGHF